MLKFFLVIFFLINIGANDLKAYIPTPIEFFNLKKEFLPNYQPGSLLEPITVCISKKEHADKFYQSIFISKLVWQLKIKVQGNYELIFKQLFNSISEELLKKLIFCQQITGEEFEQNTLCIETIYKSCILEKSIYELGKLSTCSIDQIFEFQRTIESYFVKKDSGSVINFEFHRPECNPIASLFFTDIFSHPSNPVTSRSKPTCLTKSEFSMLLKKELMKRIQYLQSSFNPPGNAQNIEQFFLLKRVLNF